MTQHAVEGKTPPAALVKAFNAVLRPLLRSPLGRRMGSLMLLHFAGRKSGVGYDVPVSVHHDAAGLYALTPAQWRLNFRSGADTEVTVSGRTTLMHGELVEDVPTVAETYLARITELGVRDAKRQIGLDFARDELPTLSDVTELVRREHFGVVRLTARA